MCVTHVQYFYINFVTVVSAVTFVTVVSAVTFVTHVTFIMYVTYVPTYYAKTA